MAAPLTEVEQLKKDAKLIGSLARQLPGIDVDRAQKILQAVELELQRWIRERQSAQDLLRQLIAQHDEMKFDIKLIYGLTRLANEKIMRGSSRELHAEILAALESLRQEMHMLHEANSTIERRLP
jgi:hypothetical protein